MEQSDLFLRVMDFASKNDTIRGVILNGSRANPNAIADIWRDYDIVYVVTDTEPFLDGTFLEQFGTPILSQCPDLLDESLGKKISKARRGWLLQFDKINRLDLHVMTISETKLAMNEEYFIEVLLDKDTALTNLIPKQEPFLLPTEPEFLHNVNEFHWLFVNIYKGVQRDELPYVTAMLEGLIRPQLLKMLGWYAKTIDNTVEIGKFFKHLKAYLPPTLWNEYLATYPTSTVQSAQDVALKMLSLYATTARHVAQKLGYNYTNKENKNATALFAK